MWWIRDKRKVEKRLSGWERSSFSASRREELCIEGLVAEMAFSSVCVAMFSWLEGGVLWRSVVIRV